MQYWRTYYSYLITNLATTNLFTFVNYAILCVFLLHGLWCARKVVYIVKLLYRAARVFDMAYLCYVHYSTYQQCVRLSWLASLLFVEPSLNNHLWCLNCLSTRATIFPCLDPMYLSLQCIWFNLITFYFVNCFFEFDRINLFVYSNLIKLYLSLNWYNSKYHWKS